VPIATKVDPKLISRSLYGPKEVLSNGSMMYQAKDAIYEYKQEIIDFMTKLQKSESNIDQKQITEKMRQILIDWMIDVHDSF
jgi:hypothetical protein